LRAVLAGQLVGAGIRADHEDPLARDHRRDGEHDVGPDDAADEVDLVLLQHLVGDLLAHVGLLLVVTVDHLDVEPADSAAEVVEGQLDGVLHVLADDAGGAGERGDEPDPRRLRRRRRDGREGREEPDENRSSHRAHGILPQVTLAVVPLPARSGNEFRDSSKRLRVSPGAPAWTGALTVRTARSRSCRSPTTGRRRAPSPRTSSGRPGSRRASSRGAARPSPARPPPRTRAATPRAPRTRRRRASARTAGRAPDPPGSATPRA